jgi:predicted acylesterase/phospholipase RssA/CRP-like cAMP-binding protein
MTQHDDQARPLTALDAIAQVAGADDMFGGLDQTARAAVEAEADFVSLSSGEILFREGDAGDALYVVLTGRLRVVVAVPDGESRTLAEIGRGEVVGEMALLTGDPRSATVIAVRDTQLVRLSRVAFERIVQQCPGAMLLVTRRLVHRLQQMNRGGRVLGGLATIAVLPAGPGVTLRTFTTAFVEELSRAGTATLVTRERAEQETGGRPLRVADWLDKLETAFRYVVYEADPADTAWTERCARQADRLLLVAHGGGRPEHGGDSLPSGVQRAAARRELVLLYRSAERPAETARWIDSWGAAAHHHIREGDAADMRRLVRLLTGRGIGLVLGGGGARGFAHIGVIEAMGEAGVPIDVIGGTSMGAVIAAQFAIGTSAADLRRLNRRHWAERNPLKDKTLPVVALLAGRRLDRMIDEMFGDIRIEDLWTRCFCVSADLTRADMRVHDRGPLGRAVRASMSLPGIAIPVHEAGSMLVDGGLLNNLPADVMRALCGRVIAVDVSPAKDLAIASPYPAAASGWRLLWGRGASKLPGIGAILMRSVMLSSTRHQQTIAKSVDLYLHPPLESFGMFQWDAVDAIADAGLGFAREAIAANAAVFTG